MKTCKNLILNLVVITSTLILTLILTLTSTSQNYITVDHNGTPTLYDNLQTAVDSAQSGDHIYVPGGSYNVSTLYIDKKLTIIGAGNMEVEIDGNGLTSGMYFILVRYENDGRKEDMLRKVVVNNGL